MSYCVNCGVELDDSAASCALCSTAVYNPKDEKNNVPQQAPFSQTPVLFPRVKRKFIASVISVVILIPNLVCTLVNIFLKSDGFWSIYINATSTLLWVMLVFPFLIKRLKPLLMWAFDSVAAALYIYVFYVLGREKIQWYFRFALPITVTVSLCVLVFMLWVNKKKRHWSSIMIHLFIDVSVLTLVIGTLISAFLTSTTGIVICLIILLSSLSLVGFFIYCNRSKYVRAWLSKKFFV